MKRFRTIRHNFIKRCSNTSAGVKCQFLQSVDLGPLLVVEHNDLWARARAKFRFVNPNELRLASGGFMPSKNPPLLISSAAAILAIALFGIYLQWNGLNWG